MVHLLEFPTEVLESILDEALSEGFDNLLLTCKRFHTILHPRSRLHKCLHRRLAFLTTEGINRPCRTHFALDLLHKFLKDPYKIYFVRKLQIANMCADQGSCGLSTAQGARYQCFGPPGAPRDRGW